MIGTWCLTIYKFYSIQSDQCLLRRIDRVAAGRIRNGIASWYAAHIDKKSCIQRRVGRQIFDILNVNYLRVIFILCDGEILAGNAALELYMRIQCICKINLTGCNRVVIPELKGIADFLITAVIGNLGLVDLLLAVRRIVAGALQNIAGMLCELVSVFCVNDICRIGILGILRIIDLDFIAYGYASVLQFARIAECQRIAG